MLPLKTSPPFGFIRFFCARIRLIRLLEVRRQRTTDGRTRPIELFIIWITRLRASSSLIEIFSVFFCAEMRALPLNAYRASFREHVVLDAPFMLED